MRLFDHIDLRVRDLTAAESFYAKILPALGFPTRIPEKDCVSYDAISDHPKPEESGQEKSGQEAANRRRPIGSCHDLRQTEDSGRTRTDDVY
jgi:hypothetical protein